MLYSTAQAPKRTADLSYSPGSNPIISCHSWCDQYRCYDNLLGRGAGWMAVSMCSPQPEKDILLHACVQHNRACVHCRRVAQPRAGVLWASFFLFCFYEWVASGLRGNPLKACTWGNAWDMSVTPPPREISKMRSHNATWWKNELSSCPFVLPHTRSACQGGAGENCQVVPWSLNDR